jgi:hypothetical protein
MKLRHIGAAAALVAAVLPPAQAATKLPTIRNVTFTLATDGSYSAAISGTNFGAAPADVPCTACTPYELQLVNMFNQPAVETINVTSWTNTLINVTGIAAGAGDAIRIGVYNAAAANESAWGGRVSPTTGVAKISSITTSGTGHTINGKGFGPAPGDIGTNVDTPFLVITDFNALAPYTNGFPWNGGYCGGSDCNGVTANYTSWTNTQVVISGFGSEYGNTWLVNPQDALCVGIWPSTSISNGTYGATTKCIRLPK